MNEHDQRIKDFIEEHKVTEEHQKELEDEWREALRDGFDDIERQVVDMIKKGLLQEGTIDEK